MQLAFGEYLPDLPTLGGQHLIQANNALAKRVGYGPLNTLTTLGLGALDAYPRSALAAIDDAGNAFNYAATLTKLFLIR